MVEQFLATSQQYFTDKRDIMLYNDHIRLESLEMQIEQLKKRLELLENSTKLNEEAIEYDIPKHISEC